MSPIITKKDINQFVANNNPRAINQTGYWLDIEKASGHHAYIIYTSLQGEIAASAMLIKQPLPAGKNYLYCPYGPVINKNLKPDQIYGVLNDLIHEIKKFIDLGNTIFIRFEPFHQPCHTIYSALEKLGFRNTPNFTQPKDTLILNLIQGETELMKNMKQKTRYNIRLAAKKEVKVIKSNETPAVDVFYELLLKTCDRDKFRPHPHEHYENILKFLGPQKIAYVYHAQYEDKIIASMIVTFFGRIATYLHGASSNHYRNLMPTYALQWAAIKDALDQDYRFYDFGGIAPPHSPGSHPWQGITQFKQGFGGIPITTIGHMEKTTSHPWHLAYKMAKFAQQS
ncbi:MAG: peptidoglycan bridge formation glycyltransferase FemA/FemB family protein [Patescibacteria group bacterium]